MEPPTLADIVLLPGCLTILGVLIYFPMIIRARSYGSLPPIRWVGFALIGLALAASLVPVFNLLNPDTGFVYRHLIVSQKVLVAHYLTPVLCCICIAGALITESIVKRHIVDEFGTVQQR